METQNLNSKDYSEELKQYFAELREQRKNRDLPSQFARSMDQFIAELRELTAFTSDALPHAA